uniref:Uncharacterized protein n=1 Tax=Rhizophora mucronata TaxID=61149 RepID=A0A2P2PMB3_RHIMU
MLNTQRSVQVIIICVG